MTALIKRCLIAFIIIIFFILSLNLVYSEDKEIKDKVITCLNESKSVINELSHMNFNVQRVEDILHEAETLFNAKLILETQGRKQNFTQIISSCDEIKQIRDRALIVKDEYSALLMFYNSTITPNMNSTDLDNLISRIEFEVGGERYDKAIELIKEANSEIVTLKTKYTTFNLFYNTTTISLKKFIYKNLYLIIPILIILSILFFILKKPIYKKILKHRLSLLNMRKDTLNGLIAKSQKEFFEKGSIPEGIYYIRINKYSELVRDINRQIPLIKEELVKIERSKNINLNKFSIKKLYEKKFNKCGIKTKKILKPQNYIKIKFRNNENKEKKNNSK